MQNDGNILTDKKFGSRTRVEENSMTEMKTIDIFGANDK